MRCRISAKLTAQFFAAFLIAAIQGIGMYHVHTAAQITEGGVLGAVLLIRAWTNVSPAVSSIILNFFCYFLGWKTLGKRFLFFSAAAAFGYAVGYGVSESSPFFWPEISNMPFIAVAAGSLIVGICTGICVKIGGAASGDDALAMSLSKLLSVPIQWVYLSSDLIVLLLSLSYIPVKRIVWSLLTVTLSGQIIGVIQRIPNRKRKN